MLKGTAPSSPALTVPSALICFLFQVSVIRLVSGLTVDSSVFGVDAASRLDGESTAFAPTLGTSRSTLTVRFLISC